MNESTVVIDKVDKVSDYLDQLLCRSKHLLNNTKLSFTSIIIHGRKMNRWQKKIWMSYKFEFCKLYVFLYDLGEAFNLLDMDNEHSHIYYMPHNCKVGLTTNLQWHKEDWTLQGEE